MLDKKYFAVVQLGGVVYGLGNNEQSAKLDSLEYLPEISKIEELEKLLVLSHEAEEGDYFVCECTESFFDHVQFMGGNINYSKDENGFLVKD